MSAGPYRRRIEPPPACDRHADAPVVETCARCGSRVCLDCLGLAGARVVCDRCARAARRRARLLHAAAGLGLAVAGALPMLAPMHVQHDDRSPKEILIKQAIRFCDARHLDFVLSSLEMRGADREIVAIGADFTAECDVPAQTAGFFQRARGRLVAQ